MIAGDLAFVADDESGLQVIQVYQSEFDTENNVGQSLAVDGAPDTILRARLTSTEARSVTWELSADAGADWTAFTPDGPWTRITVPGDSLLWRTTHTWSRGVNPTVSELTLEWLNEHAFITSIADVPNDQGGRVMIRLTRSGYDFVDETEHLITNYHVWLRIDEVGAREAIRTEGVNLDDDRFGDDSTILDWQGKRYLVIPRGGDRGGMPPGIWASVGGFPAIQQDEYGFIAETLADSTMMGIAWTIYCVTAHTANPVDWFASAPDSGYSVDNIAPCVPQNLVFGEPGVLEWDEPIEEDFAYHSVYGSESEIFDETATVIGYTVDPTFDVSGDPYDYYHVTTSDAAGNESAAATIKREVSSTPGGNAVPTLFAIRAARPNPFQAGTSIGFDLPEANHLRLTIFDSTGRLVRVVIDDHQPAGRHQVSWDGTNEAGQRVAPGIYFARIAAGSFKTSKRLVMIK
ncbi:MAG: T9SS type A sorting domain-containing protein [Candidatus Eisenbacteria sp.]|nr:T9SS type A sorting domain-containing protein [Candidatus Eisenbacteria bacterium]